MRKGLPFVLLAVMVAALIIPVGSAISVSAAAREPHVSGLTWPVLANAAGTWHPLAVAGLSAHPGAVPPGGSGVTALPETLRLLVAGVALVGLAGVARLAR